MKTVVSLLVRRCVLVGCMAHKRVDRRSGGWARLRPIAPPSTDACSTCGATPDASPRIRTSSNCLQGASCWSIAIPTGIFRRNQHLITLVSDDQGLTWRRHRTVDSHDLRKGEERLVAPRLSRLNDGRLVVLIDQDDWGHFHEDQPPGIMIYWSHDQGDTWTRAETLAGVKGFEPDRVLDLLDGSLAFAAHVMRGETQEFADVLYASTDGGKTWAERGTIAHDGFFRYCEGAVVVLDGGKELACVLRENHSAGNPSFVSFSQDHGRTWSPTKMLRFPCTDPTRNNWRTGGCS